MSSVNEGLVHRVGGGELVAWHKANGTHLDAAAYLERYRRVLLANLSGTRLLYLDTNYWVWLRDAELGRGLPAATRLLHILRAMVRSREAICVSQLQSFLEIGKQEEISLRATAGLLDELTEGLAISSPSDLRVCECAEFIHAKLGLQVRHDSCVWTKVGQIHKNELPTELPDSTTEASRNVILKALIDTLWNATFEDVLGQFKWQTKARLNADIEPEVLAKVEERKREQEAKGLSREKVRLSEFSQSISEQLGPVVVNLLRNWHIERGFPDELPAVSRHLQTVLNVAVNEFKTRSLGRQLPSVAIPVELYALYETAYQTNRPLTTNDWVDWNHGAAALPYCDMFFTERHLAHQLRQELRAEEQYDCEVIGSLDEALARLDGEAASR
jgi:hypothetical protein